MTKWREIEERILLNEKVDGHDLEVLHELLYADGKIDRSEADFLVELHKRVKDRNPAFERFFYNAINDHILADGKISARETDWLRQMLLDDDKIEDEERKFLHELKSEAREFGPEFEQLVMDCEQYPPEQHTAR